MENVRKARARQFYESPLRYLRDRDSSALIKVWVEMLLYFSRISMGGTWKNRRRTHLTRARKDLS